MRHNNYNNHNEKDLIRAITELIAFFDKFDFPLSSFEVWRFLRLKADYLEVVKVLESLVYPDFMLANTSFATSLHLPQGRQNQWHKLRKQRISPLSEEAPRNKRESTLENLKFQTKNGFYFLAGRVEIIQTRMKRYNYANRKFKKANFFSWLFKLVPWVRLIAIGNIIGPNNMRNLGDIDFFIVAERNRIWMTRAFCVMIAKIFRARPRINFPFSEEGIYQEGRFCNKDTICLSFYVTEDKLDLSEVTYGKHDFYFLYWLACLMPIYDAGGLYKKLINENHWLLSQLPNWTKSEVLEKNKIKPRKSSIYRDIVDMFVGGIEPWAKKKQLAIMPETLVRAINYPSKAVVISDQVLKLHVNDRREEYNK